MSILNLGKGNGELVDLAAARAARQAPDGIGPDTGHDADDPDSKAVAVDGVVVAHRGEPVTAWARDLPKRRVLPPWLSDLDTARSAVLWAVAYAAHVVAFHAVRLPVYWARLAVRSPLGAWRTTRAVMRWVLDAQGGAVRRAVAGAADRVSYGREDATTYLRLEEQRRSLVRGRSLVAASATGVTVLAGWTFVVSADPLVLAAVVMAALAVLGAAGRSADRPVLSRYTDAASVPRLTSDLILTALGSLGIGELNKNLRNSQDAVKFAGPIARDGAGWRADIDLPPGVTAGDVIERRDRLASGLRRPLGCVWPEVDADAHAGRLVLWVGDKAMSKTKPKAWPLAARGAVDLFEPVLLGADPRGRPVTITLMYASMVIGAQPRMGKSFTLRLLLLAAALDPRVELHDYDLKGGADHLPLEGVCHRFRVGDDDDDIAYLLADLRQMRADMRARYKTIRGLPRDVCPEGKVTPELASRRDLGLHPVVLAMDECQLAFEHPAHGAEIAELTEDLVKRGPAVGIIAIPATQRPDAKSLPTGISSTAILRLCLRVGGQLENDMVLGTSSYKAGIRATMFTRSDVGVAWLAGEGDDPVIVRAAYVDGPTAEKIAARARAARHAAGRLTGHAAGIDPDPPADDSSVLDHLLALWPATEPRLWCETLAERLATAHPGYYTGWTGEQVTAAVRPHGLTTVQVKRTVDGITANRRGLTRTDLLDALTQRDREGGDAG